MKPQKNRILIIDDESDIRDGVDRWLSANGYEVHTASNADDGVSRARVRKPHAILLDMLMPNKSGMDALGELRADGETCKIPVVMLSASLRDEQRALDAGAKYFVPKPYDGKKLVATVAAAISG